MTGLSQNIERYAEPQERFEALRERTVLRAKRDLADLSYANPYDGPHPAVASAIRKALEADRTLDLQYTPYGGATITRRLIAGPLSRLGAGHLSWRNVVLTPGAMAALNLLFRAVRDDGPGTPEIVVVTPCWLDYPLYLVNLGIRPVFVPTIPKTHRLDVAAVADALRPSTRAVILSQPANPTGVVYTEEELSALARALNRGPSQPLLISDECHRDVLFQGPLVSPLAVYDRAVLVYSFGKSLCMQGQRIGYVAVSPRMEGGRDFGRWLERLCRVMGFCTPTALMQLAVRELLGVEPDLSAVAARRGRALHALTEAGYAVTPSQATFFLYPEALAADDFAFAERLAERGVLVLPSEMFHQPGHFRISLTGSDEMLDRSLTVFAEVAREVRG